jgi:FG-GAP-like repeat
MLFRSLLNSLKLRSAQAIARNGRREEARRRPATARLLVEPLEDRSLLSFSAPVSYPVAGLFLSPYDLVVADFNGDGTPDITQAGYDVLLGNGDGTFELQAHVNDLAVNPVAADVNNDDLLDLVDTNGVLIGNGDGAFTSQAGFVLPAQFPPGYTGADPLPQYPSAVAAGDMDGDGNVDLAVIGYTSYDVFDYDDEYGNPVFTSVSHGYVNVLLGNGDGTFTAHWIEPDIAGNSVAIGDLNNDGKLDVVTGSGHGGVAILLGNGDGTLQTARNFGVSFTARVELGDLNGDGALDVAVQSGNSSDQVYYLGNGDGTLQDARPYSGWNSSDLALADVNGDGALDLLIASTFSDEAIDESHVRVQLGRGDGTFADVQIVLAGASWYGGYLAVGDFNGDGFPDLALSNYYEDGGRLVKVMLNDGVWAPPAPQVGSFVVSGFPSPTTAGTTGTFTVTARLANGTTATGYTGTVHFTSSDGQAGLPADYTFTAADQGVHTFNAVLKTAGTQSLTATSVTSTSVTGSQAGITVNPAATSTFTVAGFPSPITAGAAGSFTVTARDRYGNPAAGYTGTLHFTSSDVKAVLPGDYTFTAADAGVHTFSATLKTAGTQSLTATNTTNATISGVQGNVLVNPAAASRLILSAPASVQAGARFSLTLTLVDAYGNVVTGYRGTIAFRSSDLRANLPQNYTFTASDQGVHTFTGLRLKKKGVQTITVTETLDSSLLGSVSIDVL